MTMTIATMSEQVPAAGDQGSHHEARRPPNQANELTQTAAEGDVEKVRQLLDRGANPDGVNKYGYTALQAMDGFRPEIARMLLTRGANPSVQDKIGRTPLHDAVSKGTPATVLCMLQGGADHTIQDNTREMVGNTPVHLAVKEGKPDEMFDVLERCSSFRERNKRGQTPYDLAVQNGNSRLAGRISRFYRTQGLKSKCRIAIRQTIGREQLNRLDELEPCISPRLTRYLKLQD